ncbi:competence protein ComEC [Noviherbaspirillum humi]|uniref:Competence protein ComEC n=1 Tax=Noviherbaspirillum humi TaxID=1688639 RepID=A0A239DCD0_9BURK|nr:DNA internalization-related competence protein ComEC/Rec2 [Noviherbaspirillum humi]SNS29541.1 competence protein ComEC [Noviherbaspirillum humi]
MRSAVIGLTMGVFLLQRQARLPTLSEACLLAAAFLLLFILSGFLGKKRRWAGAVCRLLAGLVFGFAWAAGLAQWRLSEGLPLDVEGKDVRVTGIVSSLPFRFEDGIRFNFRVEAVQAGADPSLLPKNLALAWYGGFRGRPGEAVPHLKPGERWQLTVRLRRPHGNANPDGFDYEAWMLEQGQRAVGYVRPSSATSPNRRHDDFVAGFGTLVERSRGWLRDRIEHALEGKRYAPVIVALVIGDQRGLDGDDWKLFTRSGIGHLISISGLHITMVAGMAAAFAAALWRRSFFTRASLPLLLPAQSVAALAGALAALVYVLLAGFGVPAQRTLYMLSVVALAMWSGRIVSVSHVLCLALAVVLLFDPWAVLWPGFWLSFGAVAVILYASVGRINEGHANDAPAWRRILRSAAHTQYAVTVGLVPLTLLLFSQISLISPLANAIAIPLVSLLVTPLALAGSILPAPLCAWLLQAAHALVAWLAQALSWLVDTPMAVWSAPAPAWWMFALACIGMLWLLAPRGWPLRWLGVLTWLPLLLQAPARPAAGEFWATAFDVGQGMAVLIETNGHRLLYDTGPAYSGESDGGNRVILPYLRSRGIQALDGIVVSHSDNDHSGGALSLLRELRVDWVSSSLPPHNAIVQASPRHERCLAGQTWEWDGVRFEMLHPSASIYESVKWKPNARSCTLRISRGGRSLLLPGDIEAVQEAELLEGARERLEATVLLAPHHGSGTSSTAAFLSAVKPEIALFQVGYRNRYNHPKAEVYERYGRYGIRRLRSDESGAISLRFGKELQVSEYRREQARYWHGR